MKLSIEEIRLLLTSLSGSRHHDKENIELLRDKLRLEIDLINKKNESIEETETETETLEDLINNIQAIEFILYNTTFGTTFIDVSTCLLSEDEKQRILKYRDGNRNVMITLK